MTAVELQALWRDYFVFTFVRNPWNRAVSSYLMMMRSLEWEPDPDSRQGQQPQGAAVVPAAAAGQQWGQEEVLLDIVEAEEEQGGTAAELPPAEQQAQQQQQERRWQQPQQQRYQYKLEAARRYSWDDFCADPASFQHVCDQDARCSRCGRV